MSDEAIYDVVIIGGGPAGASAALYTSRANLKTLVLDKSLVAGALGITAKIANYPGVPEVMTGADLLRLMWKQAEQFGAVFKKTKVVACDLVSTPKKIFTAEGGDVQAKAVVIGTGALGRTTTLPGEEEFFGKGVSTCATCDAAFFKEKEVLVYGLTEEAAEEAIFLARFARTVTFACPMEKPKATGEVLQQLTQNPAIKLLCKTNLKKIQGDTTVASVILATPEGERTLPVAGVFLYTAGNKPIVEFLAGQIVLDKDSNIIVDREMATSVPGVFACGDVVGNAVKQAVVAAAQGVIAALSVDKFVHNRKSFIRDYK